MSTRNLYDAIGTPITFRGSGGTVLWTPQNEALGKGRISAVCDLGAFPHPCWFAWEMTTRWAATAAAADQLRLYIVRSTATATAALTDGNLTFGDAELTTENVIAQQALYIGAVISNAVSGSESEHGEVFISTRYVAVAMWNGSATKALTNTETDHIFTLTPIFKQAQAEV